MAYPTPQQIAEFHRQISPMLRRLYRARERLDRLGVPPTEELYRAVQRAHEAMHALSVATFYRSGIKGVGEPEQG